jgi:hypothetical protein
MTTDSALNIALHEVYRMVELGMAPNGTEPTDCGVYQDVVQTLRETYHESVDSARLLLKAGRFDGDPEVYGTQSVRTTWATHVRLGLPHELPLIEAMRQAVAGGAQPRRGLLEILAELQATPDEEARRRLALDLTDDASLLKPDELLRLKDALKQTFDLPAGWVREWTTAVRASAKARREHAATLVPAATPDEIPDDQKTSWPYLVIDERMHFCAQRNDLFGGSSVAHMPIADFHARIVEEHIGEDGRKVFVLSGATVAGRPFQLTLEAEEFADDRRLKAALTTGAGAQAPIYVGMGKHLGAAIQRLSGDIPSIKRYTRTGWADGTFLIPGRALDGVAVVLGRKLPYSFSAEAQADLGLQALEALLLSHTPQCGGPIVSFLLTPPLALVAHWRNDRYAGFIAGRTGSLKSSWAQSAMAMYGPGFMRDDLLVKWGQGATNNALMAMAVAAYDLPFLIDNYKPNTGDGSKGFINLIHNIVEGGEKDRLNRASELRDSRPVFAWPLVTGEDVPDHEPSSLARVLVFQFARTDDSPALLGKAQKLAQHLAAIGEAWIVWLESEAGQEAVQQAAERFEDVREEWAAYLLKVRPDIVNVLRIASSLATNELTWAIAEQHPLIGPLLQKYSDAYFEGLKTVATEMAKYTANALEATRFVGMLRDLLTTGQAVLIERGSRPGLDSERMIGWRAEDGGAYLLMGVTRALMVRHFGKDCLNTISETMLYSQMKDLEYLIPGRERASVLIKELGAVQRVAHLTALAVQGTQADDGNT